MIKLLIAFFGMLRGLIFTRKEEYTFSHPDFDWRKMAVALILFFLGVYSTWLSYAYLNLGSNYVKLRDKCAIAKKEATKSSDSQKGK